SESVSAAIAGGDYPEEAVSMHAMQDGWWNQTSVGAYGELHLSLLDKEEIDFHRWVLFLGHEFNDRVRFFSELEVEHSAAADGRDGAVELEQAYLEFDLWASTSLKTGIILIPVGILNEVHEPTTFFGTERNLIETEIFPTTWAEGGIALQHRFESGFSLDFATHSALDVPGDPEDGNAYRIRSGRGKVSEAPADAWAFTGRAKYNGIPGLELATSLQYQTDITQSSPESNRALFASAHADWRRGPWGLRTVGGFWDIGGATPARLGLDQQWGYYIEPSYRFETEIGEFGFFSRWGQLDAEIGRKDLIGVGLNYWPIDQAVFKIDYDRTSGGGKEETLNFGLGYVF
ncbi:MAG: porin, partial [Verrucomicrobiales bacterium]